MTTLHQMSPRDYDAVLALWRQIEGVGLDEENADSRNAIEAYLVRNPNLSYVARDETGEIIGAVLCGHDGRRGYLHHLAVAPPFRHAGIGSALIDRCMAALLSAGIAKCNIFVFGDNTDGRAFWKRVGWQPRPDLLFMQRPVCARADDVR